WEGRVWLGLIPVSSRGVVVGQLVGVAVFDGDFDRLLEENRVFDMIAIDAGLATPAPIRRALTQNNAVIGRLVFLARPIGGVEIILCARAMNAGPGCAVDEDHVVAFAVPVVCLPREAVDVHVAADIMAAPAGFEDDVIVLAV